MVTLVFALVPAIVMWVFLSRDFDATPPLGNGKRWGDAVADSIVAARKDRTFTSVEDIMKRSSLNKTSCDKLRKMGMFKGMDETNQLTLF